MIRQSAYGYESDIEILLEKSMLNMDKKQIKAWMKHQFDPSTMFCFIEDNKVTSCLQVKRLAFSYQNQKCTCSVFTMAATLPDYRQRGQFSCLLDAALIQCANNDLISMIYTTFPKLFESRSFVPVSKSLNYWIPSNKCKKGNDKDIKLYTDTMNLYPVYLKFLSYFDGCIEYTEEEFNRQIQYNLASKKIVVMTKDNQITGFAIYKIVNNYAQIDCLVYLNSEAIYDVLKYLSMRSHTISFTVSEYEHFNKLFPLDYPRGQGTVVARCNNHKLFSNWSGKDVRNAKQCFEQLEKPSWNHFI